MAMFVMDYLLSTVGVLLSVAFFTLVERKLMGLMHYRKGPTKVVITGLTQPIADAVKLMLKESTKMSPTKLMMFVSGPLLGITMMMLCWSFYEFSNVSLVGGVKMMLIFSVMGLSVYSMILMGWGSNSKYALLGTHRAISQVISYEVCLFLLVLVTAYMSKSYLMTSMEMVQQGLWMGLFMVPLMMVWILLCLAEANRTPFDLAEGESEIVSGFNIEYGGGFFAFIFITEYGMILFMSFLTTVLFMGGTLILTLVMMMSLFFVWARCSFPRVRYDNLMALSWKTALPLSLTCLSLSLSH